MHTHSKNIEKTTVKAAKNTTMQMLISPEVGAHFAMRKFTMEAKATMPCHTNSVEHEQYVLKGSATVTLGDETFMAKKDDVLYIPANTPHAYVAGDEGYEFLCLVPNKEDDITMF